MKFENFEEYLTNNLKINDDKIFQEKLDLLLSTDKNKKELIKKTKLKEKEELIKQRKLKEETNEKKIDFILSDENSFEKFEKKLKNKREEDEYNIDNIFFQKFPNEVQNIQNEESSNLTNTENLINNEKKKIDTELIKMNDDIKKNNPKIYNPKKIKKYKEMRDLKMDLEDKDNNYEKQIINTTKSKKEKSKNKVNSNAKNNKTINKAFSSSKLSKNNMKKNINKEIKKENDEDLIMSLIQCPIQTCHKTKNNIPKKFKINYSINEEKKNTMENDKEDIINENKSLLNIYKKEKEMKNKLQKIFLNNKNISENNFFSEENAYNNQFYNFDSNSKYLSKAKEFLLDDLSEGDKNVIREIDEQILNVKMQISDLNEEKIKYNKMIEERRNELAQFESERNKEEFEYERELINDMRSVINKFKMEIYKKEIGLIKEDNQNENKQDESETENEELKKLKDEYKDLKNELKTINKNNEKFIVDIQKKIMILKYENEQMKEKIESYQEKENFERLDSEIISSDNLLLLNKNIKKNKILEFNDEEQNITINKDFNLNNIIKTSSKLNHLKELDFEFPEKYFNENDKNNKIIKHQFDLDGKTIKIYKNNKKEIIFTNNTRKQIFPDGYTIVYFSNGDVKEIIPNNKEVYYYKKDEVYQIDFIDGSKYIKYLKTGKIFCDGNPIN